ncbi:MAG: copper amine oxidase N-terminal domain-containing protein, partial [Candidatus Gracilibacteria bacterium]|nr:copper amine oxidase N-terminal domain-containing protein [Candidatus Gracilibacteria bacterium]
NGEEIKLDVPPQIINGRTLVPIRFVGEAFGADVKWDGDNRILTITTAKYSDEPKETDNLPVAVGKNNKISVSVDQQKSNLEVQLVNNEPFTLAEDLFKVLNITNKDFVISSNKATISLYDTKIEISADNKEIIVDDSKVTLNTAPFTKNGKLYIPVVPVVNKTGNYVAYQKESQKVSIFTIDFVIQKLLEKSKK